MVDYQAFKPNDEVETKWNASFAPTDAAIQTALDDFEDGAVECAELGDVLFELEADPMAGVLSQEIYRTSFPAVHQLYTRPGTFEFYLELFRAIWGEDVEIEFEVPAPGKLLINITAATVELQGFLARQIVDNAYVYHNVVDHVGDNLVFQGLQGIKTQSEVDAIMRELGVAGVWVEAVLVTS